MNLIQFGIVIALLGVWVVVLRARRPPVTINPPTIKFTHVLPATLQTVLFAYWSLYWPDVLTHLPFIAFQLAFAYAFDFLLTWTLQRDYSPSFGPVPIVLSMNLFVWLPDILMVSLITAAALTSKALVRAHGQHIFNPAVFGLTVTAILCIALPIVFRYQDVSHDFDRPPHMAQLIFLLALIPQIRLGITPVALGSAVAMVGTMMIVNSLTGYRGGPSPWWPAWLLAITLLAGDPATIPSTLLARLLFGLFLGLEFYVVSRVMLFSVGTDFFSKILPIAIANLLVPSFERLGARLSPRWPTLAAAGNRAYVAAWIFLFILTSIAARFVV